MIRLAWIGDYNFGYKSGEKSVKDELQINQNISIIRDYSSGSNATTILCMDGNRTFYRKYAFDKHAERLNQQIQWLEKYYKNIPLPEIIGKDKNEEYCYYDMSYSSHAVGLFEYSHSMPVYKSWNILSSVLSEIDSKLYKQTVGPTKRDNINKYIEEKINRNILLLKNDNRINYLFKYDYLVINGVKYHNLPFYENYLSIDFLSELFSEDECSVIHGDLTLENIICTRDDFGQDSYYLIDPNLGNIHETSNIDYAKILQSIHGGYEFLSSAKNIDVNNNNISFMCTKSAIYDELHSLFKKYMDENFTDNQIKSIYFHEIVHWLRLLPYKIEKEGNRAVIYYATMIKVINEVVNMFFSEDV